MMVGVNVFKAYVEAWYDGRLQDILFTKKETAEKIDKKSSFSTKWLRLG